MHLRLSNSQKKTESLILDRAQCMCTMCHLGPSMRGTWPRSRRRGWPWGRHSAECSPWARKGLREPAIDFILVGNSSNIFLGSTSCHQHHFKLLFSMKYLCPHCEYEATMKENLQAHMKSIHESHKFTCPQCEYETMMSIADTSYRAPWMRRSWQIVAARRWWSPV